MEPRTQRQIQKEQTRRHLIATAIHEYARKGISSTRTADIARAANVSHGTVFAHFATQEELLSTVINEFGILVSQRLHELAAENKSLRDILAAHLQGLWEYEDFYRRLINEGRILPETARYAFIAIQSAISFHISLAAEREMHEGFIRPCPIHLLFNTWIGLIHHYLANDDLFSPGGSVLELYGQELLDHFMGLIGNRP